MMSCHWLKRNDGDTNMKGRQSLTKMNQFDNDNDLNGLSMFLSLPLSHHPSETTSTRQEISKQTTTSPPARLPNAI